MAAAAKASPFAVEFYYSSMSRSIAEHLLVNTGIDGCYLVRASETRSGAMVLSVGFQQRVHHYRLLFENDEFVMEGHPETFSSLPDLLKYFSDKGQLVTALTSPIIDDDCESTATDECAETLMLSLQRRAARGVTAPLEDYIK